MPNPDEHFMQLALADAKRGEGRVEPNPMVGCVLVRNDQVIGRGAHLKFGGPHAEINALASVASPQGASGATAYVTLEPCSHTGKTGPCAKALIDAKVARVVIALEDPNPRVAGRGMAQLRESGIDVSIGVLADQATEILAPYLKRQTERLPWMIAKWAMTLDGKIATASGDSQWISNESSRAIVHAIRGRVDGVMVGIGTALADDPKLTARPAGVRQAARIVVDSCARIPLDAHLVATANQCPTLIAVGPDAAPDKCQELKNRGCSVFQSDSSDPNQRLIDLLYELSDSRMTNILVEGGGQLLGALNDLKQIDEVHVFIGPRLVGGAGALSPVAGSGHPLISDGNPINIEKVERIDDDTYLIGRIQRDRNT